MRKKEIERLLLRAVADALDVDLPAPPARRKAPAKPREETTRHPERAAA